jgi:predicted nucleotidyltransferase component of viral defense system
MNDATFNSLRLREVFHIEFLRRLSQKLKTDCYALKDGVNLRLFFRSARYSEDMDIDARDITVDKLWDIVVSILSSPSFRDILFSFGISELILPNRTAAKQTETTQRFKIHLTSSGGEDHFTKIEFSRRGFQEGIVVEPLHAEILRTYYMPPLIVPHYSGAAAFVQKIGALAGRTSTQARDIYDLFLLNSQVAALPDGAQKISTDLLRRARNNIFTVHFAQFRSTVLDYLSEEDRAAFDDPARWDDICLIVSHRIEELL